MLYCKKKPATFAAVGLFFYQIQFLFSCQFFYPGFSLKCLTFCFILFIMAQFYRCAAFGVFCPLFIVVRQYSFFQVCSPSGIQRIVSTPDHINIMHFITRQNNITNRYFYQILNCADFSLNKNISIPVFVTNLHKNNISK